MNFKSSLLITGTLAATTYYEQDGLMWPEGHNFDACVEYYSPTPADAVWNENWTEFMNPDCLNGCMGNEFAGYGQCEPPYYFQRKFNQAYSDLIGDVACQTFCTTEIVEMDDSQYPPTTPVGDTSYPDSAQIKIGCYKDDGADRAFGYTPTEGMGSGYFTAESCAELCPDYKYIGLQSNGNRCWCDYDFDYVTRHGEATCDETGGFAKNYIYKQIKFGLGYEKSWWIDGVTADDGYGHTIQLPDTKCWNQYEFEYLCDENGNLLSDQEPEPTPDPEPEPTPDRYTPGSSSGDCSPIGAYKDKLDDRAFSYKGFHYDAFDTVQKCKDACPNYNYIGIQNSVACWCDNDLEAITRHGTADCGETGGGECNYIYDNFCERGIFAANQVLYVDAHTPLDRFADPNGEALTMRRAKGSCISFKPQLTRSVDIMSELWVTVTSDPTACALMDFELSDNSDEYYIYMKGRMDGMLVTPGYLGTRGEALDERNYHSYYMSATLEKVSTFKLVEYSDGYMLKQTSNSNGIAEDYFLLAGIGADDPIHADGFTSDLLLHGDQNGDYKWQTVFQIEYIEEKATKVIGTMMTLLALLAYV